MFLFSNPCHGPEFLVAPFHEFVAGKLVQLCQVAGYGLFHVPGRELVVAVGTADRFLDDLVDDAQFDNVLRRRFKCLGCLGALRAVRPEDGGAPFR